VFDLGETGSGSLVENLKYYLKDKQLLLVLDNYEQIIETAPQISDLLSAARDLKALVTSRQVLQVYGEQEYLVPPLSIPDLNKVNESRTLSDFEAVELFCQRAQAVKPDFANWTGMRCAQVKPEEFGTVIATRDDQGDVCILKEELWRERMLAHLGNPLDQRH
jgi:hypothetical protein